MIKIYSLKSNTFATSLENATGDLKLSDSSDSDNFKEHDLLKRIHKVHACTWKDPDLSDKTVQVSLKLYKASCYQ